MARSRSHNQPPRSKTVKRPTLRSLVSYCGLLMSPEQREVTKSMLRYDAMHNPFRAFGLRARSQDGARVVVVEKVMTDNSVEVRAILPNGRIKASRAKLSKDGRARNWVAARLRQMVFG